MRILHNQFSELPGIAANSFSLPAISPLAGASHEAPAFLASVANQSHDFLGFSALHSATCCACGQEHQALKLYLAQADGNGGSGPLAQSSGTLYAEGDVPGDTSTTETIAVGGTVTDTIEVSGDQDWFAVELVAGQRYLVTLTGTGTDPLDDPYLEVMDSNGNQVRFNDDSGDGLNSSLYFTPETSGTYYVNAHGWEDSEGVTSTGEYTITLEEAEPIGTYTFDEIANFITQEFTVPHRWDTTNLTYDVSGLSTGAQLLAIQALEAWEAITSLTFTEDTGNADITFQNTDDGAFASYSYAGTDSDGYYLMTTATVNVAADWFGGDESLDSYTYQTFLHEIGHALGLGHSGPYNSDATYGQDNIYINDNWSYSLMSYFDQLETGFGNYRFALAPQIADIIAIQTLYGTNPDGTRVGNTTYGFNSTESDINDWSQFVVVQPEGTYVRPPSYAIYDTGGTDTIDLSGYTRDQELSLVQETFSSLGDRPDNSNPTYTNSVSIARGTVIENAIGGSGNDTIIGNSTNNKLSGRTGNDTLNGNNGNDRLFGNAGDDILSGGIGKDRLDGGSGSDKLYGDNGNDILSGGNGNDRLYGNTGKDTLNGEDGNDRLYGDVGDDVLSGGSGKDRLDGGDNDDKLYGDNGNDTLYGRNGNDRLYGNTGKDTLNGNNGNDKLSGNAGDDVLSGGSGNDTLDGGSSDDILDGNRGNDTLRGGNGNDTFVLTDYTAGQKDTIVDFEQGTDQVQLTDSGFTSFAQVQAAMSSDGSGNTIITFGSGMQLQIDNMDPGDFTAGDFDLVTSANVEVIKSSIQYSEVTPLPDTFDFSTLTKGSLTLGVVSWDANGVAIFHEDEGPPLASVVESGVFYYDLDKSDDGHTPWDHTPIDGWDLIS